MQINRVILLLILIQHLQLTAWPDKKTIELFSCGAATGLLFSLFHRHWVVSKTVEINNAHGVKEMPDSMLWSPLSFNQIDDSTIQLSFDQSFEQTDHGCQFEYNELSRRVHLPTLILTEHTLTNQYKVMGIAKKKIAQKNETSFHQVKLGSIYPYIVATTLITFGTGYAFTFLNNKTTEQNELSFLHRTIASLFAK